MTELRKLIKEKPSKIKMAIQNYRKHDKLIPWMILKEKRKKFMNKILNIELTMKNIIRTTNNKITTCKNPKEKMNCLNKMNLKPIFGGEKLEVS